MTPETRKTLARAVVAVGLIGASIAVTALLMSTKPPPERRQVDTLDPLVEVIPVRSETVAFTVNSQGTVRPRIETILSAEVAGAIVSVSPAFVAGGIFERGEELLRIDPTNYEVAVEQAEALVAQRRIEYEGAQRLREQGYRAEAEYASAKAALASANAELVRARRNLERTRVSLPYAGIVRSRDADLGQYVNVGSRLGVTFSTETAEVRLPLTDQDLAFLDLPDPVAINTPGGAVGPAVTLRADVRGEAQSWQARIVRTEGVVDETTRVTYVVAAVDDPYARDAQSGIASSLRMGTFVAAEIAGRVVDDVIRVPRSALRGNKQLVVVNDENRLEIRSVDLLRADARFAYLRSGIEDGELISLTVIENPINGMRVRTEMADADSILAAGPR